MDQVRLTHGDIVEAIEIRQSLDIILVFDEFFCSAVEETNVLVLKKVLEIGQPGSVARNIPGPHAGFPLHSAQESYEARHGQQDAGG